MMNIETKEFGKLSNGQQIQIVYLENDRKIKIGIITFGARIQSIITPDEEGDLKDIVLGYDNAISYEKDRYYMGAVVGPVAGRIAQGCFPLNGETCELEKNIAPHHLHGGSLGLHQKIWEFDTEERHDSVKLILKTQATHGENGYPGNRHFQVTYILNNKNQLLVYFDADTDADTIINLTSHCYFNLSSKENDSIHDHIIMMNAQKALVLDDYLLPTGSFEYVLGKAENFSRGKKLGDALTQLPNGIDHVYAINKEYGKFGISAKAVHPLSGRNIDLVTNQPAVVLYTNNSADTSILGKNKQGIIQYGAFCLEPMHFPDSPNHPSFPSIIVKAGESYKSRNQYTFGLQSESHHH